MIEEINPNFLRIPNVIMQDKDIVPNAKYLYAIIDILAYYTNTITNEELCEISQISHNSIEKYLKQLKDKQYIRIERVRNARKITPLITHSLEILTAKERAKEIEINKAQQRHKEQIEWREEHLPKGVAEFFNEYYNND